VIAAHLGLTKTGRATSAVLDINDPHRIELRWTLIDQHEWAGE